MAIGTKTSYTLDEFAAELEENDRLMAELPVARDLADEFVDLLCAGIQRNYDDQRSGDGTPWAPHAPSTIRMYGPHPILILSGAMQAASVSAAPGNYLEVSDRAIVLGVALPYAATHEFGDPSRNIPARPFIDPPEEYLHEVGNRAADYFVREVFG